MRMLLSSLLVVGSFTAVAAADDRRPIDVQRMQTDDCARARKAGKTCVLDIGEEQVEGAVVKSDGERFTAVDWGKAASLIRLRRDFIVEILKSAEDID